MKKFFGNVVIEISMMYNVHLRAAGLLLFVPLIYTLTFGGLFYQNTVTKVPVLICNLDDGNRSQKLIAGLVIIPKDYSKKINTGGNAVVELIADVKNTVLGG